MGIFREWLHRLGATIRPGRGDDDLAEELRLHTALAAERGRREIGAAQAMDALRDQRGVPWLDDLRRDLRHAVRSLRRTPVFTAVALVTLALGIGANTAIFSIVNGVLLRPLAYPKPAQLMSLTSEFPLDGMIGIGLSYPEYREFQAMSQSFAHVGAFRRGEVNLSAGERPLRVRAAFVDEHLRDVLGLSPVEGRFFEAGETSTRGTEGPPLAMLSHQLWRSAFGGSPIVGTQIHIEGRLHDIIGIMPPGADVLDNRTDVWLPLGLHPVTRASRGLHSVSVVGRLKDGVPVQAAEAELKAFLDNWGERAGIKGHVPSERPVRTGDHTLRMRPVHDAIVADARRAIWVLQAAVALVLLIGSANLANLLMARAESRRREFAVRAALGASRGRLLRQSMTEGVLLSVTGGLLGLWMAAAGLRALIYLYPSSVPRTGDVDLDLRVLLFALTVSIVTGILFGFAPGTRRQVTVLATALKASDGRGPAGASRRHIRRALVVAQVALAVMLVVGAGLLVRTVYNLTQVDTGFNRSRLVTFAMTQPLAGSGGPDTRVQAIRRVLDTVRAMPGVESATAMSSLPLDRTLTGLGTVIENYTSPTGQPMHIVDYYQFVMSDYFGTMGIPIVAGRAFEASDTAPADEQQPGQKFGRARAVIVNETLAKTIWGDQNPIGRRLRPNLNVSLGIGGPSPWHTVIGVAKDVKEGGVGRETGTQIYMFGEQPAPRTDGTDGVWHANVPITMNVVMRTTLPAAALSTTLERVVRGVDSTVPVTRLRDMEAVFAESIGRPRLLAQLLAMFGGLAVLLAGIGTYGVLSYVVAERRREIGIRIALGAARARVLAMVMKQGLILTVIGVMVGIAGALSLNRLIAALLFGVEPTDLATIAAVVATITVVAAFACWLPAWRASRLDPNVVLRAE